MKRSWLMLVVIAFIFFLNSTLAQEASLLLSWQVLDEKIRPGGSTTVLLTLSNPSSIDARSIEIYITPGPYLTTSTKYQKIDRLNSGASQETSVIVTADSNARSINSYLTVKVTYYDNHSKKEFSANIPIKIRAIPLLQLINANYNSTFIQPGDMVLLSFDLANMGDGTAKDVEVSLGESNLFVVKGFSKKFINEVQVGRTVSVSFSLLINPFINPGTYSIPVYLTYTDETKSENYSATEYVDLVISGDYTFLVIVKSQDVIPVGGEGSVTLKVVNAGNQEARFLTLRFYPKTSLLTITPEITYIGNLKSDDYDTVKLKVMTSENMLPGEYPLEVELEYKDLYGKSYEERHLVYVKIYPPEALDGKLSSGLWFSVGLTILLCTYFSVKKLSKRKR